VGLVQEGGFKIAEVVTLSGDKKVITARAGAIKKVI